MKQWVLGKSAWINLCCIMRYSLFYIFGTALLAESVPVEPENKLRAVGQWVGDQLDVTNLAKRFFAPEKASASKTITISGCSDFWFPGNPPNFWENFVWNDEQQAAALTLKQQFATPVSALWKRGFLLLGERDNGKTSWGLGLVNYLQKPLYYLCLDTFAGYNYSPSAIIEAFRNAISFAYQNQGAVLFLDHFNGGPLQGSALEHQILIEMASIPYNCPLVVVAASRLQRYTFGSSPRASWPNWLRPGLFEQVVYFADPDPQTAIKILALHLGELLPFASGIVLANDIDWQQLARFTPTSCADQQAWARHAIWLAKEKGVKVIDTALLLRAVVDLAEHFNRAARLARMPKDLERTAYHEAGHALLQHALFGSEKLLFVSVIPESEGDFLGVTTSYNNYLSNQTQQDLLNRIAVSLGGLVAEKIVYQNFSTGVYSDLEVASKLANAMICSYGMSKLGVINHINVSDLAHPEMQKRILEEVQAILDLAMVHAQEILTKNRPILDKIARQLIVKGLLYRDELLTILQAVELCAPVPLRLKS